MPEALDARGSGFACVTDGGDNTVEHARVDRHPDEHLQRMLQEAQAIVDVAIS
ncbi:hypothetical protein [Polaromonas sp.]|uniref:hypothetical protein n=1 Tax=Polaromonas sp. TaxID=1869339 RepID=UPI00272F6AA9|nr:hypothetical protein [Polaromonas sp.]MDP1741625.1 hypothetical protein [Polaromonas sp.]